ncbi:MAG: hypothetical protein KKF67_03785 [Nanoarchaeota archaeon]|nr:hypothetical protein [Nanoarchaeota archaeon]
MKKEVIFLLILFCISFVTSSQISSTNYGLDISFGSGDNLTSTNYKSDLSIGDIVSKADSSSYGVIFGLSSIFSNCGDGVCDSDEDCSSCSGDCGACPSSSTGGSSGSRSAGAGTTVTPVTEIEFSVSPELYEKSIALNRIEFGEIIITNKETSEISLVIDVGFIEDIIFFEKTELSLAPGETKPLEFKISSPRETGIYTGKIIITSGTTVKEVLIMINVKTEKSLFDITLLIPQAMKTMVFNTNLNAQINLIQMGIKEKMDVTLNYVIKDFSGKVYLEESETIGVFDQKSIDKKFHTKDLPVGDYVLGAELIYPDGVAVASSHFKIKDKIEIEGNQIIMIALIFAVIFLFVLIILAIRKYKRIEKQLKRRKK